jgi:hypothetical protein
MKAEYAIDNLLFKINLDLQKFSSTYNISFNRRMLDKILYEGKK